MPPTEGVMAERLLAYQVRIWDRWCADQSQGQDSADVRADRHLSRRLAVLLPFRTRQRSMELT
jgi:hypothetical protein